MRTDTRAARSAAGRSARPIYVIGGFLGSGKTTLLLRMLEEVQARGEIPAVIMNEYGERSVDGRLLDHQGERELDVAELVGGCVCCDLSAGLTDTVRSLLRSTTGPIFIETTGLALVGQVAQTVEQALATSDGARQATIASVIVAVDGGRFRKLSSIWEHAEADVKSADTVVITKGDRMSAVGVRRLRAFLRRTCRGARIHVSAKGGELDPRVLLRRATRPRRTRASAHLAVSDSAAGFTSATCRISGAFDIARLGAVLERFVPSLTRVKGFVRTTDQPGLRTLQWVPGALDLSPAPRRRTGPHLVVIAKDLNWDRFVRALDSTIEPVRRRRAGSPS